MGEKITSRKAISRIGQTLFGKYWIEALTPREQWLVAQYGLAPQAPAEPCSALPGRMRYVPNLGKDPPRLPAALRAEIEIALDKSEFMKAQTAAVRRSVDENTIDLSADDVDRPIFESALRALCNKSKPGRTKSTEKQVITAFENWYAQHPEVQKGGSKDKCVDALVGQGIGKQLDLRQFHDKHYGTRSRGRPTVRRDSGSP